jgi:hypothetical protein
MSEESEKVDRFIHDEIVKRYEQDTNNANNIDTLATNLVGWNGLMISVLLTGGGFLIS